jgi:hypothetical protein
MANDFANLYLTIMFLNFLHMIGLLYGGIWYTNQQTVQCPQCGVKSPKYHVGNHECHPSLVGDDD